MGRIFWRGSESKRPSDTQTGKSLLPLLPQMGFLRREVAYHVKWACELEAEHAAPGYTTHHLSRLPPPKYPNFWGGAVPATSAPSPASLTFCPVSYMAIFNQNLDPSIFQELSLLDLWAQSLWETIFWGINLPTEAGSLLLPGFLEMLKFQSAKVLYGIWFYLEFLKSLHRRRFWWRKHKKTH